MSSAYSSATHTTVDFINSAPAMLKALAESKKNGTMIGINSAALGTGTYITSIVDIVITDYETMIITKGYDVNGFFFPKSSLTLSEIKSVLPFKSFFENPFLKSTDE